jgi:hypothetical protein
LIPWSSEMHHQHQDVLLGHTGGLARSGDRMARMVRPRRDEVSDC